MSVKIEIDEEASQMKRKDEGDYEKKISSDCGGSTCCDNSNDGVQQWKRAESDRGSGGGKCGGRYSSGRYGSGRYGSGRYSGGTCGRRQGAGGTGE